MNSGTERNAFLRLLEMEALSLGRDVLTLGVKGVEYFLLLWIILGSSKYISFCNLTNVFVAVIMSNIASSSLWKAK